jgi:hypothetical protein
VKYLLAAAVCGIMAMVLAGCGSSAPPPLAVSCTTRVLASGLIRARVTVTNTTPTVLRAIVYGPALGNTRFIQPRYNPTNVYVVVGKERRHFVGFVIPTVSVKTPAHILFHLARPIGPQSILVTSHTTVQADDWSALDNPSCTVK